jgi:DNA-binding SARP family transcriptional activator
MNDLQILLLGSPEIRWKGNLLPIQRRLTRALLFYLAARGGMVTRGELLVVFWEEHSPQDARTRLRETLSRLRQLLPIPDLVIATNDLVGLDFDKAFVDQHEFDRLLNDVGKTPWKIPVKDPLPTETCQKLVAAAQLWRSHHYMPGADFPSSYELDHWQTAASQRYEQLYRQVYERLACHYQALGNWEQAIYYAERTAEQDPLDESQHVRVLELLTSSGQFERARIYYQQIEKIFLQELGIEPGDVIPNVMKHKWGRQSVSSNQLPSYWQSRQILDAPFIGRQTILAQLWHCYQKCNNVFLSGETGIGKTRLLQEFIKRQPLDVHLIIARCMPDEHQSPFQSSLDAERDYGNIRRLIGKLPAIYARQFLRIMPELADLRPDLLDESHPTEAPNRQMLFEAWRSLLGLLAEEKRVLFVVEDVQWLDSASFEVLGYVIKRPPFGTGAMIILTGRADDCGPAMLQSIRTWTTSGQLFQIEMGNLNLADVYNLASAVLPKNPSPEFIAQLAADTGGNPCYILEILRQALQENPDLDVSKALPLPLSTHLSIIIHDRIETLSPETRQVFETAAIIGTEFAPDVVQLAISMERLTFERCMGELEGHGLITIQPDASETCYRFIHEKFRETLLADLHPLRKQQLYQQVAGALIAIYGEKVPNTTLAYYAQQAGDWIKAYEYLLAAGLEAYQANQPQNASGLFAQAASLGDQIAQKLTPEALYRLYRPWLNTLFLLNDSVTYQKACEDLLNLGQKTCSSLLMGMALGGQAWHYLHTYMLSAGLSVAEQALYYLEQAGHPYEYLSLYNVRGTLFYMSNQLDEAMGEFQRAMVIAESVEKPSPEIISARAYTHEQASMVYQARGWPERSRQHAQHALADSIQVQNLIGQTSAYSFLAFAYYQLGEYAQAILYTDFGMRLARQIGFEREIGFHHMYLSWTSLTAGNLAASVQNAYTAREIGIRLAEPLLVGMTERSIADIYLTLDQPIQAIEFYQKALACFPPGIARLDISWRMAFAHMLLGQYEHGATLLKPCIEQAKEAGADLIVIQAQIGYVWMLFVQGNLNEAWQLAESTRIEAEKRSLFREQLFFNLVLGGIAQKRHESDEAHDRFQKIAEQAALRNCPWQEIRARVALTRIMNREDWPIEAQDSRIQALLTQIENTITDSDFLPDGRSLKNVFTNYRLKLSRLPF